MFLVILVVRSSLPSECKWRHLKTNGVDHSFILFCTQALPSTQTPDPRPTLFLPALLRMKYNGSPEFSRPLLPVINNLNIPGWWVWSSHFLFIKVFVKNIFYFIYWEEKKNNQCLEITPASSSCLMRLCLTLVWPLLSPGWWEKLFSSVQSSDLHHLIPPAVKIIEYNREILETSVSLTSSGSSFSVFLLVEMALNNLSLKMSMLLVKDNLRSNHFSLVFRLI